jgi:selenide,water dikinase
MQTHRLTEYSKAAGCGCKIAPAVLQEILKSEQPSFIDPNLLVGYHSNDDAAVYRFNEKELIISTTDFFAPVVDDAFDFGRIAAANAISDIYAMGGKPFLSLALLGWPVDHLPVNLAREVMEGARSICKEAGIVLAGGHSIDAKEPFFGLTVNGRVAEEHLKQNNTAKEGDLLFITKPLGVGILTTAEKRGLLLPEHKGLAVSHMTQLNFIGAELSQIKAVHAMTDVTGFGLLGHLIEMTEGSGLSAEIEYSAIPVLEAAKHYVAQRVVPDATYRNWNFYQPKTTFAPGVNVMEAFQILPDPQTNGGLLIAVDPAGFKEVQDLFSQRNLASFIKPIGRFVEKNAGVVLINP